MLGFFFFFLAHLHYTSFSVRTFWPAHCAIAQECVKDLVEVRQPAARPIRSHGTAVTRTLLYCPESRTQVLNVRQHGSQFLREERSARKGFVVGFSEKVSPKSTGRRWIRVPEKPGGPDGRQTALPRRIRAS